RAWNVSGAPVKFFDCGAALANAESQTPTTSAITDMRPRYRRGGGPSYADSADWRADETETPGAGTRASTIVPRPTLDVIFRRPPSASTRSRMLTSPRPLALLWPLENPRPLSKTLSTTSVSHSTMTDASRAPL